MDTAIAYEKVRRIIDEMNLDAILITDRYNMRYIASYRGEGIIVLAGSGKTVITDSRYTEQVQRECEGYECADIAGKGYVACISSILDGQRKNSGNLRVGFENLSISYREYSEYSTGISGVEWISLDGKLDSLREIKTDEEIENIHTAESIGDKAFSHILEYLRPGITEKDVALELEYHMKKNGAEGLSFDTIAASGMNSSMPHAIPTDKTLNKGDFLTMDFGCIYQGYCSDMTRTVAIGQPSDEMRRVYDAVLEAQLAGIAAAKAGVPGCDVHNAAWDVLKKYGYGDYFGHGFGHSLGIEIHESPNANRANTKPLPAGAVLSAEPGVYLPGKFGVRTEDVIFLTETGNRILTHAPKHLIIR